MGHSPVPDAFWVLDVVLNCLSESSLLPGELAAPAGHFICVSSTVPALLLA